MMERQKSPFAWAEWELIVREDDIVNIKSRRYGGYLDSWQHKEVKVTDGNPAESWAQWRLGIGPGKGIVDGYELVASLRNDLDKPVSMTYKHRRESFEMEFIFVIQNN